MAQFVVTRKMSACGSAAGIDPQTAAATVNLRGAVQKSTHFLFKQAGKLLLQGMPVETQSSRPGFAASWHRTIKPEPEFRH